MNTEYTILRDLLIILLSLVSAIGVGLILLIKHLVLDAVEDKMKEAGHAVWRSHHISLGRFCYALTGILEMSEKSKVQMKEMAATLTQRALGEWERSPLSVKSNLLTAKNNLAYYWACLHEEEAGNRWEFRDDAVKYVEEVRSEYIKGHKYFGRIDWLETYLFVWARFAQKEEEKTSILFHEILYK